MTALDQGIWSDDLLGRKREAEFIKNFLVNRSAEHKEAGRNRSYVLNLDGSWGQGKTFFLDRLHRDLQSSGYLSVYVNAWKDDHADDPMIAVMSAIDLSVKDKLSSRTFLRKSWDVTRKQGARIAITAATYGVKKLASKIIGEGAEVITDIVKDNVPEISAAEAISAEDAAKKIDAQIEKIIDRRSEKALKEFSDTKISAENFRRNLGSFVDKLAGGGESKPPLFILIDELDRCRPPYAIATLERIKHFFDVPNVVFVIATDSDQLRHSIKAVYGEGFDSKKYLLRFFDRVYRFASPTRENFVNVLFSSQPLRAGVFDSAVVSENKLFFAYAETLNLTLRDIEQCYDQLRTICTTWDYKRSAQLIYIIPLVMLFQQGDAETFDALRRGVINADLKKRLQNIPPLETRQVRLSNGGVGPEHSTLVDVLGHFLGLATNNFRAALESSDRRPWQSNMRQYFISEFQTEHNSLSAASGLRSAVLQTHESVISSGSFSFESDQE